MFKKSLRSTTRSRRFIASSDSGEADDESSETDANSNEFTDDEYSEVTSSETEPESDEKQSVTTQNTKIMIPDWKAKRSSCGKIIEPGDFDRCRVHAHLEIIESRIIHGQMDEYLHPAQVIEAESKPITKTPEEEDRTSRYDVIIRTTLVPQFWVPRPWDRPDQRMTTEASLKLSNDIYMKRNEHMSATIEVDPKDNTFEVITSSSRAELLSNKKRSRRPKLIFSASKLDYLTDHFDEQTDYEWN